MARRGPPARGIFARPTMDIDKVLTRYPVGYGMLKELFPYTQDIGFNLFLTNNEKEFNQVISAYFPMKLWGLFRYVKRFVLDSDNLEAILEYLENDLNNFVTPGQVSMEPSEFIALIKLIDPLGYIVDETFNISNNFHQVCNYAPKELGLQCYRAILSIPIDSLLDYSEWAQDFFPLVNDSNLRMFRLFNYIKTILNDPKDVKYSHGEFTLHDLTTDPLVNHYLRQPPPLQKIRDILSGVPPPRSVPISILQGKSGLRRVRYTLENPEELYNELWARAHPEEISAQLDVDPRVPSELIGIMGSYAIPH